ncbi:MAG: hypothetical protein Q9196_006294 [Gyalolechia fulgens]
MSEPGLEFVSLIPDNAEAISNFRRVSDIIRQQPLRNEHHPVFCRLEHRATAVQDVTVGSPISFSSNATTDIAPSDAPGYYVLSITLEHPPVLPRDGWTVGRGRWDEDPETGAVDLLLATGPGISTRHICFRYDKFGRLALHARHGRIKLDGNDVPRGSFRLLSYSNCIEIGRLRYQLIHTVSTEQEQAFQALKSNFMKATLGVEYPPHKLTSATPSAYNLKIGDWEIHGTAGVSATTVVEAASNRRTSEAVAVKRLWRKDLASVQKANQEVDIYNALQCIKQHQNGHFVMRLHSVLYRNEKTWRGVADEVFLLWDPLGLGTFHELAPGTAWSTTAIDLKVTLFYQVCLGVQAVHETGWIHRDIKPLNL